MSVNIEQLMKRIERTFVEHDKMWADLQQLLCTEDEDLGEKQKPQLQGGARGKIDARARGTGKLVRQVGLYVKLNSGKLVNRQVWVRTVTPPSMPAIPENEAVVAE